ncbi:MAG: DUF4382 domain-containing protein [Burkholderiaceae bacterium]
MNRNHLLQHPPRRWVPFAAGSVAVATVAVLAACGGGGAGTTAAPAASPESTGLVSVAVTDAPSADFDKVWVTIREIRFHKLDHAHPEDSDWLRYPLAQPVTVDLAQLANGNLASVFDNLQLPVGTYRQIRLMLVDDDAVLVPSAQSAGLQFNDQVNYTDASGNAKVAPLELGGVREGVGVFGTFTVTAAKPLRLVLDFDIDHDVVRFPDFGASSSGVAFTLKPGLRYFDLDTSAAIVGRVDTAGLASSSKPNGAFNLVIKAEELAADGSRHVVARATTIRPDGSFTLFPLHVPASAASRTFDILVRGRNMETTIIRNVPAVRGTTPAVNPTVVASSPLPVVASAEYTVSLGSPANPTGSWVNFFQTLPGATEVPYEVRFRNVNPFTGDIGTPFPLSSGGLRIGNYVAGGDPVLAPVVPQEGAGAFASRAGAVQYTTSASVGVLPPSSGSNTTIAFPALGVDTAVAVAGSIDLKVATLTAGRYDKGQLVVSRFGSIVNSQSIDTALGNGGTVTMGNLPAGSAALPNPGAVYYAYVRVWNSTTPLVRPRVVPVLAFADLRTNTSASLNVTLP